MLKEMSASGESARSEFSLIEAFDSVISKFHRTSDNAGLSFQSDYDKFKHWEQLWNAQGMPSTGLNGNSLPMPPQGATIARTIDAGVAPMLGVEGDFGSCPQTLDEFSAFFSYGLGVDPCSLDTLSTT